MHSPLELSRALAGPELGLGIDEWLVGVEERSFPPLLVVPVKVRMADHCPLPQP